MISINKKTQKQQTLKSEFSVEGIGLHSGNKVRLTIIPAEVNNGIRFIRTDIKKDNIIPAIWTNVTSTNLCTTISNDNDISVSTIEHLMSALSGMHVDNADILIDNTEVPIMDGSSLPFVENLELSGLLQQNDDRKIIL